jgi:hypothetical protein
MFLRSDLNLMAEKTELTRNGWKDASSSEVAMMRVRTLRAESFDLHSTHGRIR